MKRLIILSVITLMSLNALAQQNELIGTWSAYKLSSRYEDDAITFNANHTGMAVIDLSGWGNYGSIRGYKFTWRTQGKNIYITFTPENMKDKRERGPWERSFEIEYTANRAVLNFSYGIKVGGFLDMVYDQYYKEEDKISYLKRVAPRGITVAQVELGNCYYAGEGVAQDYAKAAEWYRKAAEKGDEYGMNNLGELYRDGEGVAKDYIKAEQWFKKAAEKGNEYAEENYRNLQILIGDSYILGEGVPKDYDKAESFYAKAGPWGYNSLAYRYAKGDGVSKDFAKAHEYIDKGIALCDDDQDAANLYDSKGEFYLMEKNHEKSIQIWSYLKSHYESYVKQFIHQDNNVFCVTMDKFDKRMAEINKRKQEEEERLRKEQEEAMRPIDWVASTQLLQKGLAPGTTTIYIVTGVDKTKKIRRIAIKKNKKTIWSDCRLYLSEKPYGEQSGNYVINTKKMTISDGMATIDANTIPTDSNGWHVYDFGKPLYLLRSENQVVTENIMFGL